MKQLNWIAALLFAAAGVNAQTATPAPTLKIGDPAPKLAASKWVQGEAVKGFDKGTAYIVEFWATWCGPCKTSIPHLNELHNKYKSKGLVVIGQDVWERDESKVEPFLKEMGEKMTYRVALDTKADAKDAGTMATTWMKAAGRNGIPAAFVVDKNGTIAWIGHPMQLKEETLDSILDGKWDLKKALADYQEAERKTAEMRQKALEARKKAAEQKK